MEFFTDTLNVFSPFVNVSIVIFIVSFMYRFTNVEDEPVGVNPLTNLDEIFVLGNRKCSGSYVTEPKDALPNKVSGGTVEKIIGLIGTSDTGTNYEKEVIDDISLTGPYSVTAGATLMDRENKCAVLRSIPGLQDREFIPVSPDTEARVTLGSCTYVHPFDIALLFGKSTVHMCIINDHDENGRVVCSATHAFSMKDHHNVAEFAAKLVRYSMSRGKPVLIAGSPTIPKYNEEWITDGSVDKQFIKVSPLELASKIEQLGDRGIDAITIIQKMVNLLFV